MKKEVVYLSDDEVANLTAYLFEEPPESGKDWTPKKRPAILIIPGGGYSYCSSREEDPVSLTFKNKIRTNYPYFPYIRVFYLIIFIYINYLIEESRYKAIP